MENDYESRLRMLNASKNMLEISIKITPYINSTADIVAKSEDEDLMDHCIELQKSFEAFLNAGLKFGKFINNKYGMQHGI